MHIVKIVAVHKKDLYLYLYCVLLSSLAIKYSYLTLSKEMKKNRKLGKYYRIHIHYISSQKSVLFR